jgi:hypothetical protein
LALSGLKDIAKVAAQDNPKIDHRTVHKTVDRFLKRIKQELPKVEQDRLLATKLKPSSPNGEGANWTKSA